MTISSTGNVGIGLGSGTPSARLDVETSSTVWAAEINQTNTANGDGLFVNIGSTASTEYVAAFRSNNVNAFVVKGDGNVGIGTSSPTAGYKLHIKGASGTHAKMKVESTTATGQAELDLTANSAGVSYLNLGDESSFNIGRIGYYHSDNSMRFNANGGEQVRITDSFVQINPNRLNHNGLNTFSFVGHANTNTTWYVDFAIRQSSGGSIHVEAIHSHHSVTSYGTLIDAYYCTYSGSAIQSTTVIKEVTTYNGGSFTISIPSAGTMRVTHNAGAYAGPGDWYVKVTTRY
jgi:hypothetical protein